MVAAPLAQASAITAFYEASWASLPAGELTLTFDDANGGYHDTLKIDTVGLPRWLIHFDARVEAAGQFDSHGGARPQRFAVDYDLRKYRKQRIRNRYVERGGDLVAERTKEDSSGKPILPETERRNVMDPFSAIALIRDRLLHGQANTGDRFTLPIFDNERRFDMIVTIAARHGPDHLVRVHLDLRAVAGFKQKTPADRDPEDAPRPIELTFTDDARMLPHSMEVTVAWLPLVVRLDHLCADAAHCKSEKATME